MQPMQLADAEQASNAASPDEAYAQYPTQHNSAAPK